MTRQPYPPELEGQRQRGSFDPVAEGERYALSRETSLEIWGRVCANATDGTGRCDTEQAERRFHEVAARVAARGGRLRPDVGRLTRVGNQPGGTASRAAILDELAPRRPGRDTLVDAEARHSTTQAGVSDRADARPPQPKLPERSGHRGRGAGRFARAAAGIRG